MAQEINSREVELIREIECPRCGSGPHRVKLVVDVTRGALLFGGSGIETATLAQVSVACPVTGKFFDTTVRVPLRNQERVRGIRVAASPDAEPGLDPPGAEPDWRETAIGEWRKGAAAVGRDAAGRFLVAGTAAVAAYLTPLKYVGCESVVGWRLAVAVLPALGYLAVTVLSAAVLRPLVTRVYTSEEFEIFMDRVAHRQSRLLTAVLVTFVASTALAVAALVVVWV